MSKLSFSNITEAYNIPSAVIKETSEEITRLKKIVEDAALIKKQDNSYQRIGQPDKVNAKFCENDNISVDNKQQLDDFDYNFLKLSRNPQFDDIVKNYIIFKHPDWLLNNTSSSPQSNNGVQKRLYTKENFGISGNNICGDIKNYILFFIISIAIYLFLSVILKK